YGEQINQFQVRHEAPGGNPAVFEAGETWLLRGPLLHRAHGWEQFILDCPVQEGRYMPVVQMLFSHDLTTNQTTITLVYPLTNTAAAAIVSPPALVESDDGCVSDQNSIEEALASLTFSATFADPSDRLLPKFQLIQNWQGRV